jgi:hypothetical protein
MTIPTIVCLNQTTSVKQDEFIKVVAAVNNQIARDVSPIWNFYANVIAGDTSVSTSPQSTAWQIIVKDQPAPTETGFLGEHDISNTDAPEGEILAQFSEQNGTHWSSVLSHEVIELLGDQWVNLLVLVDSAAPFKMFYRELCDAVQDDNYPDADGVMLSNFVTPNYFIPGSKGPWDFKAHLPEAFALLPGGYAAYLQINADGSISDQQVFGEKYQEWRKAAGVGLRKLRRAKKVADMLKGMVK